MPIWIVNIITNRMCLREAVSIIKFNAKPCFLMFSTEYTYIPNILCHFHIKYNSFFMVFFFGLFCWNNVHVILFLFLKQYCRWYSSVDYVQPIKASLRFLDFLWYYAIAYYQFIVLVLSSVKKLIAKVKLESDLIQ